jgi:hypothetical protein
MSKIQFYLGEYVSIRDGMSELELDFLSKELEQNPHRSRSQLRRASKRKAFIQRAKWMLQDTMIAAGIATIVLGIVGIIIISTVA